ncbi:hypothetical protein [Caulobacter sp.]|uniref:hypothetical protein n=1 Tax=Caulobacter sp. TaxID=78 RepID=UPI001B211B5C|nr:hypothetical protein [Caulobacter sp.]MBO9544626.1 hypothetical protein [Caulobacter sp.]
MSAWRTLLAGLAVWLVHFAIVYALPSLDAIGAAPPANLMIVHVLATLACLIIVGLLVFAGWRRGSAFQHRIAALGAAMAGVAIVWQSAPALIG